MTLNTYYSGLDAYISYPISNDSIVSVGDGKFVIISNNVGNFDEFGYVVFQLDENGVPTFGASADFGERSYPNPFVYWDAVNEKLIILWDEYPANKYLICSITGTTVNVDSSGSIPEITDDTLRAVCYSSEKGRAVLCMENRSPDVINFYTVSLSGGVLSATASASGIAGYPYPLNTVKITFCGDYGLVALTTSLSFPSSEVRTLIGVEGAAFDISPGYAVPLTNHEVCLGIAGTNDGQFTGYWSDGTSNIPYVLSGEISGSGVPVFGDQLQYACSGWSGSYGSYMGDAVGVLYGIGVYANRASGNKIHLFSTKTSNLTPEIINSETSIDTWSFQNITENSVSICVDANYGYAVCCFCEDAGFFFSKIHVASFFIDLPQPIFWTNKVLHSEYGENGALKKLATKTVIPGKIGQPYIPARPEIPETTITSTFYRKACKKVG